MENSFQTSFIPKKPIVANGANSSVHVKMSISMGLSILILVITILSTAGLYLYKNFYLLKDKENLSANLLKIRDSFDKETIAELEMYDKRTAIAKQVLGNHIVLSPLFRLINELTLSSIQYIRFDHTTINNTFSVKMSGIARDYKSIALQADVFNTSKGKMFKDVIFSNITKNTNNYVTFDIEFNVDPTLLAYSNNISNVQPKSEVVAIPQATVSPVVETAPTDLINTNISNQPLKTTTQ